MSAFLACWMAVHIIAQIFYQSYMFYFLFLRTGKCKCTFVGVFEKTGIVVLKTFWLKPHISLWRTTEFIMFCSSWTLFVIKTVSSADLILFIVAALILIPPRTSSNVSLNTNTEYRLNSNGDETQPCRTPGPIHISSDVVCSILTVLVLIEFWDNTYGPAPSLQLFSEFQSFGG